MVGRGGGSIGGGMVGPGAVRLFVPESPSTPLFSAEPARLLSLIQPSFGAATGGGFVGGGKPIIEGNSICSSEAATSSSSEVRRFGPRFEGCGVPPCPSPVGPDPKTGCCGIGTPRPKLPPPRVPRLCLFIDFSDFFFPQGSATPCGRVEAP